MAPSALSDSPAMSAAVPARVTALKKDVRPKNADDSPLYPDYMRMSSFLSNLYH